MKVCKTCLEEKDESCFQKKLGGLVPHCKKCLSEKRTKKYAETDPEVRKSNRREYYEKNSDQIKKKVAGYRERNPDKVKEINQRYWEENKKKLSEKHREWKSRPEVAEQQRIKRLEYNSANRERHRERDKEYRNRMAAELKEKNRVLRATPGYKSYRREYIRKRRAEQAKNDPMYKVVKNLRCRILDFVQRGSKSAATMELVGCTSQELKEHLEKQFKPEMSWSNYGFDGWHIDHIKPCASFDLSIPQQQRECFHFSNLQPLWWHENIAKGAS